MTSVVQENKVFIIDLFGVLFLLDKATLLKHLGLWDVGLFYIRYRTSPLEHTFSLLDDMRKNVPGEFQDIITYKGYYLPRSVCLWQQGLMTSQQVFEHLARYLEALPDNVCRDRTLMIKTIEFLCVPRTIQTALKLNEHLYKQLCQLKKNHQLYILSNIDGETWDHLTQQHPDVFSLFEGAITSGKSHCLKPEKESFTLLLTQFDLQSSRCIFIDDQEENCIAAREVGIESVLYTKNLTVSSK
jgi:HAD superfamily hydrolase (TIGR01509 family)